jgi:hypothetical protein
MVAIVPYIKFHHYPRSLQKGVILNSGTSIGTHKFGGLGIKTKRISTGYLFQAFTSVQV